MAVFRNSYDTKFVLGTPPLVDTTSDSSDDGSEMPTIVYGDAAYGSRANIAACERAGVVLGILHKINVTPRSKGFGAAWCTSVRDQLGGSTKATRLDLLSREERESGVLEGQDWIPQEMGCGGRIFYI